MANYEFLSFWVFLGFEYTLFWGTKHGKRMGMGEERHGEWQQKKDTVSISGPEPKHSTKPSDLKLPIAEHISGELSK